MSLRISTFLCSEGGDSFQSRGGTGCAVRRGYIERDATGPLTATLSANHSLASFPTHCTKQLGK